MKHKHPVKLAQSQTKVQRIPLRWTSQFPLTIRIVLRGEDEDGRAFAESTQTVAVDRRGARIVTSRRIALGAEVAVENQAVGRTARGTVVWRGDDAPPSEPAEVIVELIESSDSGSIWGIRFPSRNDKKGPLGPTSTQVSQPAVSAEKAAESNSVIRPENGDLVSATGSQHSSSPTEPVLEAGSGIEWVDLSGELEGHTASLGKEAESFIEKKVTETAGEALAALQDDAERLRRSADEAVSFVSLAAEKAATELSVAREETRTSLRTSVEDYDKRLAQLSASGLEDLQRRAETLLEDFRHRMQDALDVLQQQGATGLAQSLQETIEDFKRRSADQFQQQALDAWKPLSEELQASVAKLADDAAKRLADVAQSGVKQVTQSIDAATGEGRIQTAQMFEEQTAAIGRGAESAAQSIRLATDEALAKLEEGRIQTAQSFEEQTVAIGRGAESAAQSIRLATDDVLAKLEEGRNQAARGFEEQTAAIGRGAESAAQSIRLAANEALVELGAAREHLETALHTDADGFRRRLAELSASEMEELRGQADALLKSFESQLLQNTLQEFQQKVAQQVAEQIPGITHDLLERSANQLQKQADDAVAKLSDDLKTSRMALVDDTREQISALTRASLESFSGEAKTVDEASRHQLAQSASQCVQAAVDSIKLATDEAVTALQAAQETVRASSETHTGQYEKRLAELSTSGIEELGRNASALLESFRGRLESALNDSYQARATELAGQLQKLAEVLQNSCVEQLQRQTDDAFKVLKDELQASGTALVNETHERIAAMVGASLESLSGKVQATEAESSTRLDQTASQRVQAALDSITLAADQGVASLHKAQAEVRTSLDTQTEGYQTRLAELATSGVEELELRARGLVEKFQGELQTTLEDFRRRGATELTDGLERFVGDLQQRCTGQFQAQADDAFKAFNGELQASGTTLVNETHERIAAIVGASLESLSSKAQATEAESSTRLDQTASQRVQAALDSITLAADQGVASLQKAQAEVRTSLDTQTEGYQTRLAELATSGVEELELRARGLVGKFQDELQTTLEDFRRRGATELTDGLERFAGDLRQRGVEQLQTQAAETLGSMSEALRTSGTDLVDDAKRQLTETAQASLESFTKAAKAVNDESRTELAQAVAKSSCEATDSISLAAEQAVARLRAAQEMAEVTVKNGAERERQSLAEASASGIDEVQRASDSVLQGFSHLLQDRARATSEEAGNQLLEALEQLAAKSVREFKSKHEALLTEQRRTFQENIDNAAEATLTNLSQKLTGLEQGKRRSLVSRLALGLVGLAPTLLFVYLATRPVMQLRVDPPAEFLAAIAEVAPKRQSTEERVARAYWDWAYLHLQHKFSFAAQLPEDPPLEMMEAEGKDFPTGLDAELTKRRYWRKLREIWAKPQAWEKSSLWDQK